MNIACNGEKGNKMEVYRMRKCECDTCDFCSYTMHNTRKGFHCEHPDQSYILNYFMAKKIQKSPCFIGFGERFADVPANKTTPKWCPKKKS